MQTIYRIENERRYGPYHTPGMSYHRVWAVRDHANSDSTPQPWRDGLESIDYKPGFRFGFANLAQLKAWFNCHKELSKLDELGYKVSVYKADGRTIKRGGKQVIFNVEKAKRVTALSIKRLIKG